MAATRRSVCIHQMNRVSEDGMETGQNTVEETLASSP